MRFAASRAGIEFGHALAVSLRRTIDLAELIAIQGQLRVAQHSKHAVEGAVFHRRERVPQGRAYLIAPVFVLRHVPR